MGPNIIYAMITFYFSLCPHVTFYKTLTPLSAVFIKGHVGFLQFLKLTCRTLLFTHDVDPFYRLICKKNDPDKIV